MKDSNSPQSNRYFFFKNRATEEMAKLQGDTVSFFTSPFSFFVLFCSIFMYCCWIPFSRVLRSDNFISLQFAAIILYLCLIILLLQTLATLCNSRFKIASENLDKACFSNGKWYTQVGYHLSSVYRSCFTLHKDLFVMLQSLAYWTAIADLNVGFEKAKEIVGERREV